MRRPRPGQSPVTGTGMSHAVDPERDTLDKAARENFPVAPFFLPRAWRADLMAVYGYARFVDDIGDGDLPPGGADAAWLGVPADSAADRLAMLDAVEAGLRLVFDAAAGQQPPAAGLRGPGSRRGPLSHPILRMLEPTVRRCRLTPEPFLGLI